MTAWRLAIALPGGVLAEYVADSSPSQYTIDGEPCAIDVTIPDDLATWHWHGSFLVGFGIAISTATCGVAGAFAQARYYTTAFAESAPRQMTLFEVAA